MKIITLSAFWWVNWGKFPSQAAALKAYALRMWIDEMFGDWKKNGFDIESTHLRDFIKLSRLTLAVAVLYFWLVATGSQLIRQGLRGLVDRNDRQDLSIFQTGLSLIERQLTNSGDISISFSPVL